MGKEFRTKEELLLSMAITAVNWGEGADFEAKELIWDSGYEAACRQHFPHLFPEPTGDPDEDRENIDYDKIGEAVQRAITKFLRRLQRPYILPDERRRRVEERLKQRAARRERAAKEEARLDALFAIWLPLAGKPVTLYDRRGQRTYTRLRVVARRDEVRDPNHPDMLLPVPAGELQLCRTGFAANTHIFRDSGGQFSDVWVKSLAEAKG